MEMSLYCNYSKCHKILNTVAWVTSCSHIFCDEHGVILTSHAGDLRCPACTTIIEYNVDIVKMKLNPSEHNKSMALAGLSPHTILDITIRAVNFWSFQVSQEYSRLQMVNNHYREQAQILTTNNDNQITKIKDQNHEINSLKKLTEELRIEIAEKTRAIQKLHLEIDSEKRKTMVAQNNAQRNIVNDEAPFGLSHGINLNCRLRPHEGLEDLEFENGFFRNITKKEKPLGEDLCNRRFRKKNNFDKHSKYDDGWFEYK